MLPLLKRLFWYFCLVIRELKKRLRDTQLTCKTKEKRAVFWLLLFFLKELYMFMHTSISGSCYHHPMLDIAAFPCGYELESNSVACYFVKTRQHHLWCFLLTLIIWDWRKFESSFSSFILFVLVQDRNIILVQSSYDNNSKYCNVHYFNWNWNHVTV